MNRDHLVQDIADHIEDLTVRVLVEERYLWSPRVEGLRHRDKKTGRWVEHTGPLPAKQARRINRKDPALVVQLDDHSNDPYATGGSHEPVSGSKPGSRPPLDVDTYDTLERLTADAAEWRAKLCAEVGKDAPKPAPVGADLAAIRGLSLHPAATTATLQKIASKLKAAINESLIRLSYKAPMVTLAYVCGECGGKLIARQDATTDPLCVGGDVVKVPWRVEGCGGSYPRSTWADLLSAG